MAWNTIQTAGNVLERDYIHDFATSDWTLVFNLDLPTGVTSTVYFGAPGNPTVSTTDVPAAYFGFATVLYSASSGNVSTNVNVNSAIANINPPFAQGVGYVTRTNLATNLYSLGSNGFATPLQKTLYGDNLAGPYVLIFNSAGTKNISMYLYQRNQIGSTDGVAYSSFFPLARYASKKDWSINLIQKAVAITRQGSSVGPILLNGTLISSLDVYTSALITLNKSSNRGDNITSSWAIYKQDGTGAFVVAGNGTDYSLGPTETLTSDEINLTYLTPGVFRVINQASGTTTATSGSNDDYCTTDFVVSQVIIDEITLPTVTAVITPVVVYGNTVVSTSPLVGVTNFTISVSALIDTTNASWVQTLGTNPPVTLTMSPTAWEAELNSRCFIKCIVQQGTTIVQTTNGLGPHQFTLTPGSYQVGYSLTPKTGLLYDPLGNITLLETIDLG